MQRVGEVREDESKAKKGFSIFKLDISALQDAL